VADLAARRARVSEVLVPGRMAAQLSWLGEGSEVLGTLTQPCETLYDGARAYLQVSGRWTSFSRTDPAGPRSINDPLWPLDAMAGANGDAVETGADLVRDTSVTCYRLTVDLARASAAVPAGVSRPARLPRALSQVRALGRLAALSRLPAQVWLDRAGLIRRAAVSPEPAADGSATWLIVDLWDFGLAVDITPPRPDEIVAPRDAYRDGSGPET
jgi:hypothetical protein